jgi:tRNA modification GTPase
MSTFVCITSGLGWGAVSVIELFGEDAEKIFKELFRGKRAFLRKPLKLCYGEIVEGGLLLDEVIVRYLPGKESFSGEETFEICCHGGGILARRITKAFINKGAIEIPWEELLEIAWKNKRIDSFQKDAYKFLPKAKTRLAAKVLADQARGALSNAFSKIASKEDIEKLLKSARLGIALTHPHKIIITGAPNVGKSTLFNRLVGRERVLVHDMKGTTRDWVDEIIAIEEIPFILVDTAGLWNSNDKMVQKSMEKTHEKIREASLIIVLYEPKNQFLVPFSFEETKVIKVLNKIDLLTHSIRWDGVAISALMGIGIDLLKKRILHQLGLCASYSSGSPVVFTPSQKDLLENLLKEFKGNSKRDCY